MRTAWQLVKGEAGMTLGLTMVIIVMIGVMGAGLLTFVSTDLNTVLEVNRGQRAFEVADAGVGVAKRQLNLNCSTDTSCIDHYDDLSSSSFVGNQDYQWSAVRGGVTLNDLDGAVATQDNVTVKIDYRYATDDFKVVSTGNYGVAKRKIEAIFKGISGGIGGTGLALPTYYTPSAIRIEDPLTLNGLSLFSESDILINNSAGLTTPAALIADYEDNGGYLKIPGVQDRLSNWNSTAFAAPNTGTWNTVGRGGGPNSAYKTCKGGATNPCTTGGLAALGKICGAPITAATCGSNPDVADGVYGYDSTTGSRISGTFGACPTSTDPLNPKTQSASWPGNKLTFCSKNPSTKTPNDPGTITFPFPRPTPNAARLRGYAQEQGKYFVGAPSTAQWSTLTNAGTDNQVIFIDAQGATLDFNTSNSANNKGILVVWCGNLQLNAKFQGIILNLYPNGAANSQLPGGSTCDNTKGIVTNNGQDFSGWLYAQGGNSTTPGIVLRRSGDGTTNPSMNNLPGGAWSFFNDAFSGGPPTSVQSQGWRELYQ